MRFQITILLIITFAISCKNKHVDSAIDLVSNKKSFQNISFIDSLNKYSNIDSIVFSFKDLDVVLYIGKTNNINFGTFIKSDSLLLFYQKIGNTWRLIDSLKSRICYSFLTCLDLNGDKINDIRISCISGANGNTENIVFIFDNRSKLFKHNRFYDLPNIEYDSINKFIKSWWFAGIVHCQQKWKYQITSDSLKLVEGIIYCLDEKTEGETGSLELFKMQKSKKIVVEKKYGSGEKLRKIFDKTFWDSSDN